MLRNYCSPETQHFGLEEDEGRKGSAYIGISKN